MIRKLWFTVAMFAFCTLVSTMSAATATEPDTRLTQRVTLDCCNVRLHNAIEQIAAQTSVTIRSGSSSEDWKSRDIPVFVSARDVPLGNLLRAIADSTHLLWSSGKDGQEVVYRVWRDKKRQSELDLYHEQRKAADVSLANYDWDLMAKVADLPESEFEDKAAEGSKNTEESRAWREQERSVSRILRELGSELKDRAMGGEAILLTYDTAPESIKPYFREAFSSYWKAADLDRQQAGMAPLATFGDEQLAGCYLNIAFDNPIFPGELGVEVQTRGAGSTRMEGRHYILAVGRANPNMPPRPKVPVAHFESDKLDSRYTRLKTMEPGGPEFLDKKVTIERPKDKKNPTYWDLLRGISEKIGYSIIAEGPGARPASVAYMGLDKLAGYFGIETTAREALKLGEATGQEWYVDEQAKVIIGRDSTWIERLEALVPQKLLLDMQKKLENQGIELDDLEPVVWLTDQQIREWITFCPEIPDLQRLPISGVSMEGLPRLYLLSAPH